MEDVPFSFDGPPPRPSHKRKRANSGGGGGGGILRSSSPPSISFSTLSLPASSSTRSSLVPSNDVPPSSSSRPRRSPSPKRPTSPNAFDGSTKSLLKKARVLTSDHKDSTKRTLSELLGIIQKQHDHILSLKEENNLVCAENSQLRKMLKKERKKHHPQKRSTRTFSSTTTPHRQQSSTTVPTLPDEIWFIIFKSYAHAHGRTKQDENESLLYISRVCKKWRRLITSSLTGWRVKPTFIDAHKRLTLNLRVLGKHFPRLRLLDLSNCFMGDFKDSNVQALPTTLRSLNFSDTGITTETLRDVAERIPELKELVIRNCKNLDSRSIRVLPRSLNTLVIRGSSKMTTYKAFRGLKHLPSLTKLAVSLIETPKECLKCLPSSLRKLSIYQGLTNDEVQLLPTHLFDLRVGLKGPVPSLARLTSLQRLDVLWWYGTGTGDHVQHIPRSLKTLILRRGDIVGEVANLCEFKSLSRLHLGTEFMEYLHDYKDLPPSLLHLGLQGRTWTMEKLEDLPAGLKSLALLRKVKANQSEDEELAQFATRRGLHIVVSPNYCWKWCLPTKLNSIKEQ